MKSAARSRAPGYLLLCTALCAAKPIAAQVHASKLEVAWSAPPECPGREAVLEILYARLPERRATMDLRVHGQVVRRGAEYQLTLELESRGARASRRLTQRQCAPLAEAAAVLIALAIEPEASSTVAGAAQSADAEAILAPEQAETASPSTDVTLPPRAPAPEAQTQAAAAPKTSTNLPNSRPPETTPEPGEIFTKTSNVSPPTLAHLQLQLSAAARAGLGTFPEQPALGVQAQLALRISSLYMAVGVTYWPAREQSSPTYPSARLRGSGIFSDLGLGWELTMLPFVVTPALNLELGQLSAEANGIEGPELNRALWLAAGAGASIALNLSDHWAVSLELSALVPISRTHWLVRTPQGDVQAFVAAPLTSRLSLRICYVLR